MMFKSKLLLIALTFSLIFGAQNVSKASNSEGHTHLDLDVVEVSSFNDSVKLVWNGSANSYEIYSHGEKIYAGKDQVYTHEKLEADTPMEYTIVALDEQNQVLDKAKIETYTKAKANKLGLDSSEALDSLRVTTIYKNNYIKFDWEDIPNIKQYEVYKDNVKGKTLDESEYSEKNLNKLTGGTYEFIGKIEIDDSRKEKIKKEAKQRLNRELTHEEEQELFFYNSSIIKIFNPNTDALNSNKTITTKDVDPAHSFSLLYQTFIKDQFADNPYFPYTDKEIKYFGGDGRGFNPTSYAYRTRTESQYIFPSRSLNLSKSIGTSKFYDSNKSLKDTRVASSSGIYMSEQEKTETSAKFIVYHSAAIPYNSAISPSIDYNYTATLNSENGGKFTIYGSHDKAPHHEFYYKMNGSGPYKTLFQHENQGFKYLFGMYPNWTFNISN